MLCIINSKNILYILYNNMADTGTSKIFEEYKKFKKAEQKDVNIQEFDTIAHYLDFLYQNKGSNTPNKGSNTPMSDAGVVKKFIKELNIYGRVYHGERFLEVKNLGYPTTPLAFLAKVDMDYLKALMEIPKIGPDTTFNQELINQIYIVMRLLGFEDSYIEYIISEMCKVKMPCSIYIILKCDKYDEIGSSNGGTKITYSKIQENIDFLKSDNKSNIFEGENVAQSEGAKTPPGEGETLASCVSPTFDNLILKIFQETYSEEYAIFSELSNTNLKDNFIEKFNFSEDNGPIKNYFKVFPNYTYAGESCKLMNNWERDYPFLNSIAVFKSIELGFKGGNFNYCVIRIKSPDTFMDYCNADGNLAAKENQRRQNIIALYQQINRDQVNLRDFIDIVQVTEANYLYILRRLLHIRNNFNTLFQGDGKTYNPGSPRKEEVVTQNVNIQKQGSWGLIKLFEQQVLTQEGRRNSIANKNSILAYNNMTFQKIPKIEKLPLDIEHILNYNPNIISRRHSEPVIDSKAVTNVSAGTLGERGGGKRKIKTKLNRNNSNKLHKKLKTKIKNKEKIRSRRNNNNNVMKKLKTRKL